MKGLFVHNHCNNALGPNKHDYDPSLKSEFEADEYENRGFALCKSVEWMKPLW